MRGGDEDIIPVVDVGIGDGRPTIVYPLYGPSSTVSVCEQNLFAGRAKLPGDEDNGSMALWYIFSTIGIYPFCPGKNEFVRTKRLADGVKILGVEFDADSFSGNKIRYEDVI